MMASRLGTCIYPRFSVHDSYKWNRGGGKRSVFLPLFVASAVAPSFPLVRRCAKRPRGHVTRFAQVSHVSNEFVGSELVKDSSPRKVVCWGLLWSLLLEKHKLRMFLSALTLIGCTMCTLSMPIFSGQFFEILIGNRHEQLWRVLCKMGVLYMIEPIFTVLFVYNMNVIWEQVMSTLRTQIFTVILIQKIEFFDRFKVGEVSSLITSDLNSLKNIVGDNLPRDRGFRAITEVVGTVFILFTLAPQLAPILGTLMVAVSVAVGLYKRSTIPVFKAHGIAQASMADSVTESFSAIRTVRSFGGEKRQITTFGNQVASYQRSGLKLGLFKSLIESSTRFAVYFSLLTLFCLGGTKVMAGELSVGIVAAFIGYTFTLTFAVQGLINTFGELRGAVAAVDRINSILSQIAVDEALASGLQKEIEEEGTTKLNIYLGNNGSTRNGAKNPRSEPSFDLYSLARTGDVVLEDLHFAYPLRPDVEVLSGLNLRLQCGEVTALVGPSGSGKSTIVQLLSRFYEPKKGRITVAGVDVRSFEKTEWARVFSVVSQEPVLFSVSVGDNIAYGLPDDEVSKDDVIRAAKAANAHDFISSLPKGYDTLVGERGGLLSGGQRQRIAIARALLKDAPILILDEATSALDAESERLVQDALTRLMKDKTTLVIAHRLSTVQKAHQIALCGDGKVAELGTHLELLSKNGRYASLVAAQRLAFE